MRWLWLGLLLMASAVEASSSNSMSTTANATTDADITLTFTGDLRINEPFAVNVQVTATRALSNASLTLQAPNTMTVLSEPAVPDTIGKGQTISATWLVKAETPHLASVSVWLVAGQSPHAEDEARALIFIGTQRGIADFMTHLDGAAVAGRLQPSIVGGQLRVDGTFALAEAEEWQTFVQMELKLRHRVDGQTVREPITYGAASAPLTNTISVPLVANQSSYHFQVEYQANLRGHTAGYPEDIVRPLGFRDLCNANFRVDLNDLNATIRPCLALHLKTGTQGADASGLQGVALVLVLVAVGLARQQSRERR